MNLNWNIKITDKETDRSHLMYVNVIFPKKKFEIFTSSPLRKTFDNVSCVFLFWSLPILRRTIIECLPFIEPYIKFKQNLHKYVSPDANLRVQDEYLCGPRSLSSTWIGIGKWWLFHQIVPERLFSGAHQMDNFRLTLC